MGYGIYICKKKLFLTYVIARSTRYVYRYRYAASGYPDSVYIRSFAVFTFLASSIIILTISELEFFKRDQLVKATRRRFS